jgi:hypothetical protein
MAKNFTLILEDEPLPTRSIVTTIYGEPGVAKTSLAFTSENSLLLDFDGGVERSVGRTKTLKLNSWAGVNEFLESDTLEKFNIKTLIADTAESMLKYMADFVIQMNPSNAKNDGTLGLSGYGAIKTQFEKFLDKLAKKNIDLVVIAHSTTEKEGDNIRFVPKITGGSYDILMGLSDLVGYIEIVGNNRVLDFNPRARHYGKNFPGFEKLVLPDYKSAEWKGFLGDKIATAKKKMSEMNEAQVASVKKLEEVNSKILECENVECLEKIAAEVETLSPIYRAQVSQTYDKRYLEAWSEQIGEVNTLDELIDLKQKLTGTKDKYKQKLLTVFSDAYVDRWKKKYFKNAKTAEDFNALVEFANALEKGYQPAVKKAIAAQAETLGLAYDATKKTWYIMPKKKEEKPKEEGKPAEAAPVEEQKTEKAEEGKP